MAIHPVVSLPFLLEAGAGVEQVGSQLPSAIPFVGFRIPLGPRRQAHAVKIGQRRNRQPGQRRILGPHGVAAELPPL